jgi:hypothetical protein
MHPLRVIPLIGLVSLLAGCPGSIVPEAPEAAQNDSAPAAQPAANDAAPAGEDAPRQNALQREAELVDRRAFLEEHPNAIELQKNVINAKDPFTAVSQGYFAGVSSLTISAYKHDLELWKNLRSDNSWPPFEEYKKILETHNVKLKGLKKGQVYAYDDQTGEISILEIPAEGQAGA